MDPLSTSNGQRWGGGGGGSLLVVDRYSGIALNISPAIPDEDINFSSAFHLRAEEEGGVMSQIYYEFFLKLFAPIETQ